MLFSYLEVTQEEADQGKEVDMTFSVSYRYTTFANNLLC
jgi:hypothetical protein